MPSFSSNAAPTAGTGIAVSGSQVSLKSPPTVPYAPQVVAQYTIVARTTGTVSNAINYTPPAVASAYRFSGLIYLTAQTGGTQGVYVTIGYTNEDGTAKTQNLPFVSEEPAATFTAPVLKDQEAINATTQHVIPLTIFVDNSATAITATITNDFATSTFSAALILERLI